jgi:hypothetical protein
MIRTLGKTRRSERWQKQKVQWKKYRPKGLDPWDGISSIGLFASANAQTFESFPEYESSKKKKKKRRRGFSL